MNLRKIVLLSLVATWVCVSTSCAGNKDQKPQEDATVLIETSMGNIKVKLYPETTKHRQNFLKLVTDGFYSGLLFHRVINHFMIQAGDPKSKTAQSGTLLGDGDVGYTIPAEFIYPKYYHKRGALAAAREGDDKNPKKASSGCQFYIVQGKVFNDQALEDLEKKRQKFVEQELFNQLMEKRKDAIARFQKDHDDYQLNRLQEKVMDEVQLKMQKDTALYKYNNDQWGEYCTNGGTPHLDNNYTVFGEVIEGMDIVDKIAGVLTDKNDRPALDIKIIKAEIIKP